MSNVSSIEYDLSENSNYITNCRCDTCNTAGPVVVLHHYGAPVLAQCKVCGPHAFEQQARNDINKWLTSN